MEIKNIKKQQQEAFIQNLEKGFMVSNGVYADNFLNRKLGRVGQPYKNLSERIEDKKDLKKSKYLADLKWTVDKSGSKNGRGGEIYFDCPQGRLYAGRHGYYIKTKENGEEVDTKLSENEAYNFVTSKDWENKNSLLIEKKEKKEAKSKEKNDKDALKRSLYLRDLKWKKDDNGETYVQTKGGPLFAGRHSYYIYDNNGAHNLSEDDAFLYANGQSSELSGEAKKKVLESLTDKLSNKSYKNFNKENKETIAASKKAEENRKELQKYEDSVQKLKGWETKEGVGKYFDHPSAGIIKDLGNGKYSINNPKYNKNNPNSKPNLIINAKDVYDIITDKRKTEDWLGRYRGNVAKNEIIKRIENNSKSNPFES